MAAAASAQQLGSIRGSVSDADFGGPLRDVRVQILETRQTVQTGENGQYFVEEVPSGTYTLVFAKLDYARSVKTVTVLAGELTEQDVEMEARFVVLPPVVAEPSLSLIAGSLEQLDLLRQDSPSLIDAIDKDALRRTGVGDAGEALKAIPGATVAADATAVVRGLPDRYVPSLVNGVRLPSANEDKRAVELDQFPTAILESIQVSKTFTPDKQGDASGGEVNVVLKSIPEEPIYNFSLSTSYNTQATNEAGFLSYDGGGVGGLGRESSSRAPQLDRIGENWEGAVGVSPGAAPRDYKFSGAVGGDQEYDSGVRVGGFVSVFYERDSTYFDNGQNNQLWLNDPSQGLVPQTTGLDATEVQTALFDLRRASQFVQWGGTLAGGIETDNHRISAQFLYSHTAEDIALLGTDTRGKLFYFPDYDPNDPAHPGNTSAGPNPETSGPRRAPWLRTQTLEYTERTTGTLQLAGEHTFPIDDIELGETITFKSPEVNWVASSSFADLDQPDRRLFGEVFIPRSFNPGAPPFLPAGVDPSQFEFLQAVQAAEIGNLQRNFKSIEEDGKQISMSLELPFSQWDDEDGYFKFGLFQDKVDRTFLLENYSNTGSDQPRIFQGGFSEFWSDVWNTENHPINPLEFEVDYDGSIDISAHYGMLDIPLSESVNLIGGARIESTDTSVILSPEEEARWVPPGPNPTLTELNPGDGDTEFSQRVLLPSLSAIYQATDNVTLRGAYSRTIARQTFKELVPVIQQEFLGGPVFIGNPDLEQASLENFDFRVDYKPAPATLLSASYFFKNVENPIENIQRVASFGFTTPVNYPEGELSGVELEVRQDLGTFSDALEGLSIGANATLIDSKVSFPEAELAEFELVDVGFDQTTRDATNAPEHLYNLFLTYNIADTGTQIAAFYTVQGDTLVAGDSTADNNFIPAVYQREFGTLNLTFAQRLTEHISLRIAAKNLTNPSIEEVYRSSLVDGDAIRTTFTRGVEYSIGLSASFSF